MRAGVSSLLPVAATVAPEQCLARRWCMDGRASLSLSLGDSVGGLRVSSGPPLALHQHASILLLGLSL